VEYVAIFMLVMFIVTTVTIAHHWYRDSRLQVHLGNFPGQDYSGSSSTMFSISMFEEEQCPSKYEDFKSCATVNSYNHDTAPPKYKDIRRSIDMSTQHIDFELHI
jgi:hypothetical protein